MFFFVRPLWTIPNSQSLLSESEQISLIKSLKMTNRINSEQSNKNNKKKLPNRCQFRCAIDSDKTCTERENYIIFMNVFFPAACLPACVWLSRFGEQLTLMAFVRIGRPVINTRIALKHLQYCNETKAPKNQWSKSRPKSVCCVCAFYSSLLLYVFANWELVKVG